MEHVGVEAWPRLATIVPSSSSTRTCRKSCGSWRSGSNTGSPQFGFEVDFAALAVVEPDPEDEAFQRFDRMDALCVSGYLRQWLNRI